MATRGVVLGVILAIGLVIVGGGMLWLILGNGPSSNGQAPHHHRGRIDFPQCEFHCRENVHPVRKPSYDVRDADAKHYIVFTDGTNQGDTNSLHLLMKSPKAIVDAIYICNNGFAPVGASFRNIVNLLNLYGAADRVKVWAGCYASINDTAADKLDYLQAVPPGAGGRIDSGHMWSTSQLYPQAERFYDLHLEKNSDAPEGGFVPIPSTILALKALLGTATPSNKFTFLVLSPMTPIVRLFQNLSGIEVGNLASQVERAVILGGVILNSSNTFSRPPFADDFCNSSDPYYSKHGPEFSFYLDPHAAQDGLQALENADIPITLVTLDGTDDVPVGEVVVNTLSTSPATPEAQVTGKHLANFRDSWFAPPTCFYYGQTTSSCCGYNARGAAAFFWEESATLAALYPDVIVNSTLTDIYVEKDRAAFDYPDGKQGASNICPVILTTYNCTSVNVVYDLDRSKIYNYMIQLMQSPVNSAKRSLYCAP